MPHTNLICTTTKPLSLSPPTTNKLQAHRQFIDVMAWHPEGHHLATSSNEAVIKFWCREPPGSTLDSSENKDFLTSDFALGPIPKGTPSNIAPAIINPQVRKPL